MGSQTPSGFLNAEMQARLDRLGYEPVTLFTPADLAYLRATYERFPQEGAKGFHATMHRSDVAYRQRVHECVAPLVTERLLGVLGGFRLRVANWVVKESGETDSTVSFHQDWSFVDERRCRSIHLWFPLIDVGPANGCLEVVPGSHRVSTDLRSHADPCRFDNLARTLRAKQTVFVPLEAGQGLFYDGALLHASPRNHSTQRRVAAGTVLIPEDAVAIHAYRISLSTVEVYAVDDAFFWRHTPGTKPVDVPLIGTMASSTFQHGEDVLRLLAVR